MKKILSAGIFCAVFSWPVLGMAQSQQEKDKIETANTHMKSMEEASGGSASKTKVPLPMFSMTTMHKGQLTIMHLE